MRRMNNYITMCFWNEEIQELWKPKVGDETIWKPGLTSHMINKDDFQGGYDSRGHPDEPKYHIWLPKQEDLQKIYKKIKHVSIDCEMFEKFMQWMFNFTCTRTVYPTQEVIPEFNYSYKQGIGDEAQALSKSISTLNELWLAFVMEECFNKFWNCETKKWELISC